MNYYTKVIKPVMDSIKKEERLSVGAGGKKQRLSEKEKFKLLVDFMNLRANPEKNRAF